MDNKKMDRKNYESMIRVDHAGEFGAIQIYKGQKFILKRRETQKVLGEMLSQEEAHFAYFDEKIKKDQIRPTFFIPLWRCMGFGMGAVSALLGRRAAMACTAAVEEVIEEHYAEQIESLEEGSDLQNKIKEFRDDEIQHKELGIEKHAKAAPFYPLLRNVIRSGTKLAIFLSKKI